MSVIIILCFISLSVILLYLLFDVHYFVRIAAIILWGRLFQKRKKIFEKTVNYGICLTSDVDVFLRHMNNARYLRELDFARSSYYCRSGIFAEICRRGDQILQAATSIRYRRPISVLTVYKVITKLIYWDEKSFYIEHAIVSLSDDFVRAIALSKQSVRSLTTTVPEIIEKLEPGAIRPQLTDELRYWIDSMEESSQKLKKTRKEELKNMIDPDVQSSSFLTTTPATFEI